MILVKSFINNPKDLDLSYGSRSLGLFWKEKKTVLQPKKYGTPVYKFSVVE